MKKVWFALMIAASLIVFLGRSSISFAADARDWLSSLGASSVSPSGDNGRDGSGFAATLTVTNANDSGSGSLRQAILDANDSVGGDLINFSIPGSGVHTISVLSQLPIITDEGVTIDGYTQPGARPNALAETSDAVLLVELKALISPINGLVSNAANTTIRGLVINGFNNGILLQTSNVANCIIEGNFIGTNATGMSAVSNFTGIAVLAGSGHRIGGSTPASRNILSGNSQRGISFNAPSGTIAGNFVGLGADGQTVIGNGINGISLNMSANGNTVGGLQPGSRNVISGNVQDGLFVTGDNNLIQGNYVGTDATGMVAKGNATVSGSIGGVSLTSGSGNVVGGTTAAARNVISGNGTSATSGGVSIRQSSINAVVQGNYIGTAADGIRPIGNVGNGVYVATQTGPGGNVIGGTAAGQGNLIAYNGQAGVFVTQTAHQNPVRGNSMYWNGGIGIDLNPAGSTPNDLPCDADTGANMIQNRPEIQSVTLTSNEITISVRLRSVASTQFTLDFYSSYATGDEGSRYVGSAPIMVDADCDHTTSVVLTNTSAAGPFLTATATDPLNNTSEFSAPYDIRSSPFDFDFDKRTDIGIFRPSGGQWWINRSSNGSTFATPFGASTDAIAPGDYTGDGRADIAVWRPSTGEWLILRSEDFSYYAFPFGTTGDVSAPADYDGDRKMDAAVYRPSTFIWYVQRSGGGGTTFQQFGAAGDLPVPSDYDGDGRADVAIFRPSQGSWWMNRSTAGPIAFVFGNLSDKLVPGDYTGDGRSDIALWRPSTGEWFILRSEDSSYYAVPFGLPADVPAPGDYDGDGRFDYTVFRPSDRNWYSLRTTAGPVIQQFGLAGDRPVGNAFVP